MNIRVGSPSELSVNSEKVTAFFKNEWTRPISLGDNKFYNWQFIKTPYQNHEDSCCIVIDDNSEILGVMGVNDRSFRLCCINHKDPHIIGHGQEKETTLQTKELVELQSSLDQSRFINAMVRRIHDQAMASA
ncbi:hypothetical protein [methane-oxidizing endosymbiont of Gigantopelta aegis]|uniref:hypothetical protein n=1 Tax=methane-oxidizing endosymbiont of Gigantopelta aegis TaxID=2794938 RepID=UPI001FD984D1|nr:hypothetical protein [methane-oxidizing endosymbiont of Gigantopelta aegis]